MLKNNIFYLFLVFLLPVSSFSYCKQSTKLIHISPTDTISIPAERHLFYQSIDISIYVDKVLYESPSSPNFWLRFVIENHTATRPIIYFDLKDPHKHIYPNQWGIYSTNKRTGINEKQISPLPVDSIKKPFKPQSVKSINSKSLILTQPKGFSTINLKHILPNGALEYYVEFNGIKDGSKKNINLKKGEFFITSLDGQLLIDFGNHLENIACDELSTIDKEMTLPLSGVKRELVLPYPITYKPIPATAQNINLPQSLLAKAGTISTYESGIGMFYTIHLNKSIAEMVAGNQHISDIQLNAGTLDILEEENYPKITYYLSKIPWPAFEKSPIKHQGNSHFESPEISSDVSELYKNPWKEKIPKNFLSSKAFQLINEKEILHGKLKLVKVIEIAKGMYMVGIARQYDIQEKRVAKDYSKIILISDTNLYYEIPFDISKELVSFDVKGNMLALALNSDQGFKDGELSLPMPNTQVFLIDISLISGNINKENLK